MDRFEQMAKREIGLYQGINPIRDLLEQSCSMLLRRQHAAMVRMVKRQHNKVSHDKGCNEDEWQAGYLAACTELLTALAQYKKGTP